MAHSCRSHPRMFVSALKARVRARTTLWATHPLTLKAFLPTAGEVACAACRCVQRVAHSTTAEELGPRIALDLMPGKCCAGADEHEGDGSWDCLFFFSNLA